MMAEDTRRTMVAVLADAVTSLRIEHPTRVAVDGRSAAGKTTLANDLADTIRAQEREVLRASIDDFHRPGHKHRSQRGGWTPQAYYDAGFDYNAFRDLVLLPLGPSGSRRCRPALFDAFHDVWWPEEWHAVGDRTVAIIDGVFLLRPELAGHWDYVVWLDIDMETMVERARRRDVAWVGSAAVVEDRYRQHWIPTHDLYERLIEPQTYVHAVIDNRRPQEPTVLRLSRP
jgi:uridine kinase